MGDERHEEPSRVEDETILTEASDPGQANEWSLVRRAQEGDRSSFEQLYRMYAGNIYALCLRLSRKPQEAEDTTQEVFVRAWEKLESFRSPGHFAAWLKRVAVNLTITSRRTVARRGEPQPLFEEYGVPGDDRGARNSGARVDLEKAIAALPGGARTVFVLHDIHGYRHGEIAEMTGTAMGTTKAQLHRARKRLREYLER
jgi:RNA polymerase sigma-70 factor (ECF subfamily)